MADSFIQEAEATEMFRKKNIDTLNAIFKTSGSGGSNSKKLAQLVSIFDFTMSLLSWDKTIVDDETKTVIQSPVLLSTIIVTNQATIDGKYHKDYKDIATIEELDKKRKDRGINTNQQMVR